MPRATITELSLITTPAAFRYEALFFSRPRRSAICRYTGITSSGCSVSRPSAGGEATLQLRDVYRNGLRILAYADLRLTGEQRRKGLEAAFGALAAGRLRIPIGQVWPLEDVNRALGALADRAVTGKVILQLR
ncbi:MAG: zinc-binding dehydrogenase [Actinobacteria bacterium]|nr:MAG: zinc-binding dehydrogenase [Actinomycetota bacterium]